MIDSSRRESYIELRKKLPNLYVWDAGIIEPRAVESRKSDSYRLLDWHYRLPLKLKIKYKNIDVGNGSRICKILAKDVPFLRRHVLF